MAHLCLRMCQVSMFSLQKKIDVKDAGKDGWCPTDDWIQHWVINNFVEYPRYMGDFIDIQLLANQHWVITGNHHYLNSISQSQLEKNLIQSDLPSKHSQLPPQKKTAPERHKTCTPRKHLFHAVFFSATNFLGKKTPTKMPIKGWDACLTVVLRGTKKQREPRGMTWFVKVIVYWWALVVARRSGGRGQTLGHVFGGGFIQIFGRVFGIVCPKN